MSRSAHRFLSKKKQVAGMAVGAIALLAMAAPALSQETAGTDEAFQLTVVYGLNNTNIGNPSGVTGLVSFDISWVDDTLHKYYLADRSNKSIDILDLSVFPPALTQVVNNGFTGFTGNNDKSGPDGLATVNNHTELWVGDATPGTGQGRVWFLKATDASVLPTSASIPQNPLSIPGTTTRADEFCFDSKDNLVMIASPAESPPFVTFIDTVGHKIVGKLIFDGKHDNAPNATNGLEQCGWSPSTGKFYQNVPEVDGAGNDTSPGAIAVINPKNMKVERLFTIPLEDCAGPQGMAIGPDDQILEGCNAKGPNGHRNTVVVSAKNGNILTVLQDLGGDDEVWFNPGDGHYLIASCNTACRTVPVPFALTGPEVLGVVDSKTLQLDQTVFVASQNSDTTVTTGNPRTIHSVAGDAANKQIILPIPAVGGTAPQFGLPAPGSTLCDKHGGTFPVLVQGPSTPSSTTGCIVILAAPLNNDPLARTAKERPKNDEQD
jgi:hypothetical protein